MNMFKTAHHPRRPETRRLILDTALQVFRQRGLEAATMRDLAVAARVSLGAAYYYFPSKEAIIQAYYDEVQAEHAKRVSDALAANHDLNLNDRLSLAFRTKLEILQGDRKILGSLFRYTGEPEHPLSAFGPGTSANRRQSMAVFAATLGDEELPEDIRAFLPLGLWALHLGILLYFIYDDSPQQQRTLHLLDGLLTLLVNLLAVAKFPLLKPFRQGLLSLLRDSGLLPDNPSPHMFSTE
jgi:AcrR family transcriptional regulator